MAKLNQIIAIEKGTKSRVYGALTELNKLCQKSELFNGFTKIYSKKDEEGEDLPSERKTVQLTAGEVIDRTIGELSELMNVTARKDATNCVAKADVKLEDGSVILGDVPVTHLLFLEKQLNDIRTIVSNLPVLDSSDSWTADANSGLFRTDKSSTHRTKKVQRPIVLYAATPEHPAQTQLITEDVVVGFWETTKMSGSLAKPEKDRYVKNIDELIVAVKQAREQANSIDEVFTEDTAAAIFNHIFK